jgi:hypothetical protein
VTQDGVEPERSQDIDVRELRLMAGLLHRADESKEVIARHSWARKWV